MPVSPTGLVVESPFLKITKPLSFDAPETSAILETLPEGERPEQLRRMMELGAQTASTIRVNTTVRMVEAQMAALSQDLGSSLNQLLLKDRTEALNLFKDLVEDHRVKVATTLIRYLDPDSQASVPAMMGKIFDEAGDKLIKRFEDLLSEGDDSALGRLAERFSTELSKAAGLIIEQMAAKHALATRSALSGRPYEEALEDRLISLAQPLGDQVTRCGDTLGLYRRRSGDVLLTIAPDAVGGRQDIRIVLEAKRRGERAHAFSHAEIQNQLTAARRNRGAGRGLFVTEASALLPLGRGFHEYGTTDIAVAWHESGDDLALAIGYRLLRCALIGEARETAGVEIDREAYTRTVGELRKAITKLDTVYAQHQAVINSIGRAASAVDDFTEMVVRLLRQLDELMGA
jgi:hypothetical protein